MPNIGAFQDSCFSSIIENIPDFYKKFQDFRKLVDTKVDTKGLTEASCQFYNVAMEVVCMAKAKKLPSGSWRVRIKDTSDTASPWKSFTASTAAEAEFLAAQYLYERKEKVKPENKTVGECMDAYIDGRSNILSPSTISLYRLLRRTAYPDVIEMKVGKITQSEIQSTINKYAGGHAYKTIKNAEAFLHVVLAEYRPDFYYKVNMPMKERKEIVIPTTDEVNEVIKASVGTDLYLPILFGALLGMRRSEVCALTWDDIDLKNKTVRVDEALVLDEYNAFVRKKTKTTNSKRTLTLPQQIIDALPSPPENIIALTPKDISRKFGRLAASKGYKFTFHGLRHYNASVMLKLAIPDKYAMERMGHASNQMLKRVYQHTFDDEQRVASEKMQAFINQEIKTSVRGNNDGKGQMEESSRKD